MLKSKTPILILYTNLTCKWFRSAVTDPALALHSQQPTPLPPVLYDRTINIPACVSVCRVEGCGVTTGMNMYMYTEYIVFILFS